MADVLIVDDSVFQQNILQKHISKAGYSVASAADGMQAIAMIINDPPMCVVMDLIMPHMDGFEVLERIRHLENAPPVIVNTADIQQSTYEECLSLGAYEVLNKPVDRDVLLNLIAHIDEDHA